MRVIKQDDGSGDTFLPDPMSLMPTIPTTGSLETLSVRRRTWGKRSRKKSSAETTPSASSVPSATQRMSPEKLAESGTEHGEQAALFFWAAMHRKQWPVLEWMYAIPNGGGRSAVEGSRFKAEGVKKGVSDVCLPVAKRGYHGLYIEMKRANGKPTDVKDEQGKFLEFVQLQGYYGCVCFGWEQASKTLEWYLNGSD